MWLIEELWIDTLENRNAYGYKPVAIVATSIEAEIICGKEFVKKSAYPWPLSYAQELPDPVPKYKAIALPLITSISDLEPTDK